MDVTQRAEAAFEKVWENFKLDKLSLRSLNERDKTELKGMMKTIFLASFSASPGSRAKRNKGYLWVDESRIPGRFPSQFSPARE